MKVTIRGYDIECTPQEFLELVGGVKYTNVSDIQTLPDDIIPNQLPDDFSNCGIDKLETEGYKFKPKDFPPYLNYPKHNSTERNTVI